MQLEETQLFRDNPAENLSERGSEYPEQGLEGYVREVMKSFSREIKSESRDFALERFNSLSVKLNDLAQVLREAGERLREKESPSLANLVEAGSESLTHLSKDIRENYSEKIIGGIENFARNRPVIFLGAALTAGVLIWQLSSASQKKPVSRQSDGEDASSAEPAAGRGEEYHERH